MTPRAQFLEDCRRLWDESDGGAMLAVGRPGFDVLLLSGPMEVRVKGDWVSFRLCPVDLAQLDALSTRIIAADQGGHGPTH